jgi:preprotein translocase subunit SecE
MDMAKSKVTELKESAKSAKPSKDSKKKDKSPFLKIKKYFKDLKSEFKKVVWPSRKQIVNNTAVVLSAMVVSGVFIWGIDTIFTNVLKLVLGA